MAKVRSRLGLMLVALACALSPTPLPAQTGSVEDDAQEYTRLVMRHDRLALKNNMDRKMSQAELAEIATLRTEFEAIKAKYGSRGPSRALAAAFDKRVKELSAEVVAPAVRRWVAEEFPEPRVVAAAYPDELQASAAMQVLHDMLKDKVGQPPTPEVSAKLRRYEAAWMKINPQSRPDYSDRLIAIEKSMWNKRFQFDVLSKFVPLYAVEAGNQARTIEYDTDLLAAKTKVRRASFGLALLILALPLLYLARGSHLAYATRPRNPDEAYPFRLPRSLETVKVFRKRISVELAAGKITDRSSWTQTTTWTSPPTVTYSPSGSWTFSGPTQHSSTTTFYKYTVTDPEGASRSFTFVSGPDLETGGLFGVVYCGPHVLLHYDHTKGDRVVQGTGSSKVLAMPPGFLFWLASMAVATAGSMAIRSTLVTGVLEGNTAYESVVGMTVLFTAVLSAIYIAILRAKIRNMRERKFVDVWMPRYRKFMEELTPALKNHFRGGERQRVEIESGPEV